MPCHIKIPPLKHYESPPDGTVDHGELAEAASPDVLKATEGGATADEGHEHEQHDDKAEKPHGGGHGDLVSHSDQGNEDLSIYGDPAVI